jgi:hypothetical protein
VYTKHPIPSAAQVEVYNISPLIQSYVATGNNTLVVVDVDVVLDVEVLVVDVVLDVDVLVVVDVLLELVVVVVIGIQPVTSSQKMFSKLGSCEIAVKIASAIASGQSFTSIFCKDSVRLSHLFIPVQDRLSPV